MKKILAIIMAALVVFTTCSIAVMADETAEVETTAVVVEKEEATTRNILNDEGLVVPINMSQFKSSIIFKIFEKILSFILSLFGDAAPEVDQEGATLVDEIGSALDERLTDLFG